MCINQCKLKVVFISIWFWQIKEQEQEPTFSHYRKACRTESLSREPGRCSHCRPFQQDSWPGEPNSHCGILCKPWSCHWLEEAASVLLALRHWGCWGASMAGLGWVAGKLGRLWESAPPRPNCREWDVKGDNMQRHWRKDGTWQMENGGEAQGSSQPSLR